MLPFFKPRKGFQFAGSGLEVGSGGGGGGGGGGLPYFSTTETKTGRKWVDGKDTYIKTIEISSFSSSTHTGTYDASELNISTIVNIDGIIPYLGLSVNAYDESGYYTFTRYRDEYSRLECKIMGYTTSGVSAYVTIEYTKTTD